MAAAVVIDLTGEDSDASEAASNFRLHETTTPAGDELTPATSTSPPALAPSAKRRLDEDKLPPAKRPCFNYNQRAFDLLIPVASDLAQLLPNEEYDINKIVTQVSGSLVLSIVQANAHLRSLSC